MKNKYINQNGAYGSHYTIQKKNHHVACTFHIIAFCDFLIITGLIVFYQIAARHNIEPVIINRIDSKCYVRSPKNARTLGIVTGKVKSITAAANLYMDDVMKRETKYSKEMILHLKNNQVSYNEVNRYQVRKIMFEGIPWIS